MTTYYHAADRSPLTEPTLVVDSGLAVLNSCVLTEVAPPTRLVARHSCRPPSWDPARPAGRTVRARLAELYDADTSAWETVAAYTVEGALPAMRPPWPLSRTTRFAPGRYVCGDHRATGSVQGALASGSRAAREVLADRAAARTTGT